MGSRKSDTYAIAAKTLFLVQLIQVDEAVVGSRYVVECKIDEKGGSSLYRLRCLYIQRTGITVITIVLATRAYLFTYPSMNRLSYGITVVVANQLYSIHLLIHISIILKSSAFVHEQDWQFDEASAYNSVYNLRLQFIQKSD